MTEYEGLLPLYKPRGMTSHDCVFRLRKLLRFKKIGHSGTLDPDVDGVLILCLGRATKVAQYLLEYGKKYKGVIRFGTSTTTEDAGGEIVERKEARLPIARAQVERVFDAFRGEIRQSPPMYSAVKVNGRKLYEYAREGMTVERPVRHVRIFNLVIDGCEDSFLPDIPFEVMCSKGTYVRTLAVDIGRKLGYPSHLHSLTRIKEGPFELRDCLTFEQVEDLIANHQFAGYLKPLESGLGMLDSWTVDDLLERKIIHGAVLPAPKGFQNHACAVYNNKGNCLAVYRPHPDKQGLVKPEKVLVTGDC
ncbi:tRNA pseudouridine(55) synthase TruB [Sporolactobacillus putidus]|uniref:tRNA pseudouridine synthase B n=1 Tax=Sporolactobacillus putidus TaxID=492735 RepID=A0A917RYT8_9BACL|nr:tRNA pseudouridine(55) synthase TruB [Sporolactobacillus putidus]GGL43816.1 tRNA pseudouridine synthase B [Sporolactobacillus putidus]